METEKTPIKVEIDINRDLQSIVVDIVKLSLKLWGTQHRVAKELQISRKTIYRWIKNAQ